MIGFFLILILVVGLYSHFEPFIDFSKNGDILLWYNSGGRKDKKRTFTVIYSKNV